MRIALSGVQPTGRLHIGNYFGHLKQLIEIQNRNDLDKFRPILFIADLHSITSGSSTKESIGTLTKRMAAMCLATGIDPLKTIIFRQSDVLEHVNLMWLLMSHVSTARLGRMLQWKVISI